MPAKSIISLLINAALLLSLCSATFVYGQPVQNYFSAQVAVKSQSAAERKRAAELALEEVLIRMSGTSQVLLSDAVVTRLGSALNYVEQFKYESNTNQAQVDDGFGETITIEFAPASVERLLRQESGQPFWPVSRPGTLVWLVEDSIEYGRQLVNNELAEEVFAGIFAAANKRGLPLNFPLMDLQDQMALSADQVWNLDEQAILEASERYSPDAVLVGRYSATSSGRYLATWQFFHRGDSRIYDSRAEQPQLLGAQALNPLADYLGRRYAIISRQENASALVMQLQGISSFSRYRAAISYLEGLAVTTDVFLAAVRGDALLLYLNSDSGVEKFISTLALENRIEPVQQLTASSELPVWMQVPQGTAENPLSYRWQ